MYFDLYNRLLHGGHYWLQTCVSGRGILCFEFPKIPWIQIQKNKIKQETIYNKKNTHLGPEINTKMFVFLKGAGTSGRGLVIRMNTHIAYI